MTTFSALALTLLTLPAWVAGGPLVSRQSTGARKSMRWPFLYPTKSRTAINSTTFSTLQLYAQYATVSYCAANYNGRIGAKVTCPGGTCPLVEQKNVTIVANQAT
jgi:hypothetical protein